MENTYRGMIENENVTLKIVQDHDHENPREWENIGEMICFHSRHALGDKHKHENPQAFLESLAEDLLDTDFAKELLEKRVEEEHQYIIGKKENGNYVLLPPVEYERSEEHETHQKAMQALDEKEADAIVSEVTRMLLTPEGVRMVLNEENVKAVATERAKNAFSYEVVEGEKGYATLDNRIVAMRREFATKEDAENEITKRKEEAMGYAFDYLTLSDLIEISLQAYVLLPLYLYEHGGMTMNTRGYSCSWDSGQVGFIYASKETFRNETAYTENELFHSDAHRTPAVGEHVRVKGHRDKADYAEGFGKVAQLTENTITVDFDYGKTPSARDEANVVTVSRNDITEVMSMRAEEMLKGEVETYDRHLRNDVYGFILEKEEEIIDSCWGFYGSDFFRNGLSEHLEKKYHSLLRMSS